MTIYRSLSSFLFSLVLFAALLRTIPSNANVVGTDMQNFNATTSGLDFVTVQSSETLKPGIVNLGFFLNYAVNTLPYYEATATQSRANFNDTILGADLNAGMGITRNWDFGVSFPQVLNQTVRDQNGVRGEFQQTGATEIRLNSKYRLLGNDSGGVAAIGSVGFNRIQDNPWVGRDGGPIINLELAVDTTSGRYAYGANIGYRIRNRGARIPGSQIEPLKDQYIASGAISYHLPDWNTKLIGELFGSFPAGATSSNSDRSLSSLEILGGAKHDLNDNLALHGGIAAGIWRGVASPDWRLYTGVNYTFGPLWGQNDLSDPPVPPNRHMVQIIPEEPAPPSKVERYRTQNILFAFDSDGMIGNYGEVLAELAQHLKTGFSELIVEGHTDSIGTAIYNQKLSLKRAEAIKSFLVAKFAFKPQSIITIGFGETRPIGDNGNYQGRQQNRRVEFEIKR